MSFNVKNQKHYTQLRSQPMELITKLGEDGRRFSSCYILGNIVKYISRYKFKDGLKDILKAQDYYLNHLPYSIRNFPEIARCYLDNSEIEEHYLKPIKVYCDQNQLSAKEETILLCATCRAFCQLSVNMDLIEQYPYPMGMSAFEKILLELEYRAV